MTSPDDREQPKVGADEPDKDSVGASTSVTSKAPKSTKETVATQRPHDAAGRHDWQGKPREGRGGRQAGLCLHQQLAAAATLHRRTRRCPGGETLPALQRSVKWGMAWYGVGDGWCFSCGGFAGHVKLTFGRGTSLTPVPPVTPIGMGKDSRGVDLASVDDLDERQVASWMNRRRRSPVRQTMSSAPGGPGGSLMPTLLRSTWLAAVVRSTSWTWAGTSSGSCSRGATSSR